MGLTSALVAAGVAIVVIGPRELPSVARKVGFMAGRGLAFFRQLRGAVREASKGS